jgi:hypothetical protein
LLSNSIRIQIDEKSGASSVIAYNGHDNMLNACVNEIPSVIHSANNNVVIAQLYDAAYFKDGIFRRFYFYFLDSSDAQKFCSLYNRESSILRTINKLTDCVNQFKAIPVCRSKEESKVLHSSHENEVSFCLSIHCFLKRIIAT